MAGLNVMQIGYKPSAGNLQKVLRYFVPEAAIRIYGKEMIEVKGFFILQEKGILLKKRIRLERILKKKNSFRHKGKNITSFKKD